MADHYADSSAPGGGTGSYYSPWNSLSQVNAHTFIPGDNMWFKGNSLFRGYLYIRNSGANGSPILYGAYGSGNYPKICGAELLFGWTTTIYTNVWQATWATSPRFVLFDGVVGDKKDSAAECVELGDWYWASNIMYTYCEDSPDGYYIVPGVEVGSQGWSITTDWSSGKDYITLKDLHVYGAHNGPGVFSTRTRGWIVDNLKIEKLGSGGMQMRSATDLTVKNCTLTGIRNLNVPGAAIHGIYIYYESSSYVGSNFTAYGNTITQWPTYGITIQGMDQTYRFSGVYVHDNDLSHNATGVYPGESDTGEIYNNICDDNLNPYKYEEEYGIAFETVSNFEVHHNTCTNGRVGMEIWGYEGSIPEWLYCGWNENNHIHHNVFANNTSHGFLVYMGFCKNHDIHTNIMYNNTHAGAAISEAYINNLDPPVGNKFYNNTLSYNAREAPYGGGYGDIYLGGRNKGWTIKNNIVRNTDRLCLRSGNYPTESTHEKNCYYRASGTVIENFSSSYSLAQVTTFEPTAIAQDPKFVSTTYGAEDFHLQADSPCIDQADPSIQDDDYTDYDGNPIV